MQTSWSKLLAMLTLCSAVTLGACVMGGANTSDEPDDSGNPLARPEGDSLETQAARLQWDIDDVLARTPGARQISVNEIEITPDLHMKLPLPGKTGTNVLDSECPFQYLCAYQHSDFGGAELNFLTCGREWNLGRLAFPGGGFWNDKISSVINNQTPNTPSFFYDYTGSGNVWARVLSINSGHYLRNLAFDTAEGGGGLNDRIDGVHVCGSVPSPWVPNWP